MAALLLGACGAGQGAGSSVAPPPVAARPDPAAERWRRWAEAELVGVPSAIIGVIDRDGLRWSHGVGSRNARGGPPPDAGTVYRIGSVTKLLTASAVLQRRDAGALTLDARVAQHVPELADRLGPTTLRHLLTHTSGIPSVGDGSAPYWEQTPPTEAALLRALDTAAEFAPGSQYQYSNAGMALAGLVVARSTGADATVPDAWRSYVEQHLLRPLGMTAVWSRAAVDPDRLALGVGEDGTIDPPHWELGAFEPAGGLYASLADLVGLVQLALGRHPEVLAPASLAEALTDDPLPGPHGAGWVISDLPGGRVVGHGGSTMDYASALVVAPEAGLGVVVLRSGGDAELAECVALGVLEASRGGPEPASCRPTTLEPALAARVELALRSLRALLAVDAPSDERLAELFTPAFLTAIPPPQLRAALHGVRSTYGACDQHEVVGAVSGGVRATLRCRGGALGVVLEVDQGEPPRLTSLLFR